MTICSLEKNQFIGLTWCEELDRYEYKMTRSATAHTNIDGARNYPTLKPTRQWHYYCTVLPAATHVSEFSLIVDRQ
jgi:hypothetical protein